MHFDQTDFFKIISEHHQPQTFECLCTIYIRGVSFFLPEKVLFYFIYFLPYGYLGRLWTISGKADSFMVCMCECVCVCVQTNRSSRTLDLTLLSAFLDSAWSCWMWVNAVCSSRFLPSAHSCLYLPESAECASLKRLFNSEAQAL